MVCSRGNLEFDRKNKKVSKLCVSVLLPFLAMNSSSLMAIEGASKAPIKGHAPQLLINLDDLDVFGLDVNGNQVFSNKEDIDGNIKLSEITPIIKDTLDASLFQDQDGDTDAIIEKA